MVGLNKAWSGLAAAVALAGCDGGASAVPAHRAEVARPVAAAGLPEAMAAAEARTTPVRRVSGKPVWSSNRRFTADQNARRHFERDGAAFGAATVEDYVARAHRFTNRPPKGAQTLTRANGDRLIYDPASNVFAVATREGAPRTMFKPGEGPAYWDKVKAREAEGGARASRSRGEG